MLLGKNDREEASEKVAQLDHEGEWYPSDHFVLLHGEIIEDCLAARPDPTLFNGSLKSLQVSLDTQRHYSQCISDRLDAP
jgi:hypothetical protein